MVQLNVSSDAITASNFSNLTRIGVHQNGAPERAQLRLLHGAEWPRKRSQLPSSKLKQKTGSSLPLMAATATIPPTRLKCSAGWKPSANARQCTSDRPGGLGCINLCTKSCPNLSEK